MSYPIKEYVAAFAEIVEQGAKDPTVPHEVASRVLKEQISPIRAWGEHLSLTQAEVAARMDVSQSDFAQMEAPDARPRLVTLKKVAAAMGLVPDQLKW